MGRCGWQPHAMDEIRGREGDMGLWGEPEEGSGAGWGESKGGPEGEPEVGPEG